MTRVLLIYATREGQTAKIALAIGHRLQASGHHFVLCDARDDLDRAEEGPWDAVVLGASVHRGRFEPEMRRWMIRHRKLLSSVPASFFAVCLAAASRDPEERQAAQDLTRAFLEDCGLPQLPFTVFAGALRYRQYGWFTRRILRSIARREGGATDSNRDHEYTDWAAVQDFADQFGKEIPLRR